MLVYKTIDSSPSLKKIIIVSLLIVFILVIIIIVGSLRKNPNNTPFNRIISRSYSHKIKTEIPVLEHPHIEIVKENQKDNKVSNVLELIERQKLEIDELQKKLSNNIKITDIPTINISKKISILADTSKQDAIRNAARHAFNGYASRCFGQDEVNADTGSCENWLGQGNTITDSMDTLWIMGLKDEFEKGKQWISSSLHFNHNGQVSFFETTIRVLGGLLSTYELSGDKMFLDKAVELGNKLLAAFNTPSGMPRSQIDLNSGASSNAQWNGNSAILSEIGTVQVEFAVLAKHTGRSEFDIKAHKVFESLDRMNKPLSGLYPIFLNIESPNLSFTNSLITLGAMGDSFYEYLLKYHLLNGDPLSKKMYIESMKGVKDHLYQAPRDGKPQKGFAYLADHQGSIIRKMDHLVCFAAGMLALGAYRGVVEGDLAAEHMKMAEELTETCVHMYFNFASGISPEFVNFSEDGRILMGSAPHNLLRPETVESLMILYRITKNEKYRTWGWTIFQSFEKHSKANYGYSGLRDVSKANPEHHGKQESFFIAETLKYLYLLFSDDQTISLDDYVINTEAHPFKKFNK